MRREKVSFSILLVFSVFFITTFTIFISPYFLPSNNAVNLDGSVIVIDNDFSKYPYPLNWIYVIGDFTCHQKESRSWSLNGNEMPVCSRCFAIMLGVTIGVAITLFYKIKPSPLIVIIFALALLPISLDVSSQAFGYRESTNIIRSLTGLPVGFMSGIAIGIFIDEYKLLFGSRTTRTLNK